MMINIKAPELSIRRQCELIGLSRSSFYYQKATESALNLELMHLLDEAYTRHPFLGRPRLTHYLRSLGYKVNEKRVSRLMGLMDLRAIYPAPKTTQASKEHKVYPYLLRDIEITGPNQVWSADITYVPMHKGFMYLMAILDWYSRYVIAYRLSNSLDNYFCIEALNQALSTATPLIFNTDQGRQFTARNFTDRLEAAGTRISMDGRGRVFDNIFIERLWRTVKYEDIYLNVYDTVPELIRGLSRYFSFYNHERQHQSLGYLAPAKVHFEQQLHVEDPP